MAKFDMKKHEQRMMGLLTPPTKGMPLIEKLREAARKKRFPPMPR